MKNLLLILLLFPLVSVGQSLEATPSEAVPQSQSQSQLSETECCATDFTLRTNTLYWLGGLMNIGVEWRPGDTPLGVVINGGYSPFGDTDWSYNLGGWFVSPELRFYLSSNDRWFAGLQFLAEGYNVKLSDTGYQGTAIGGGVMGGYRTTLSHRLDIDFTLGFGYAHLYYDTYFRCEPNSINPYISKGVTKDTIFPLQVGVNLIWKTYKR